MKRRAIIAVVVLLALGGYATWQFGLLERLGLVEAKSTALTLYGNVDIRQVELGFRVAGRIAELRFQEGDMVKKGDLLAVLDDRPYMDALDVAAADLAAREADLKKFSGGSRPQEIAQARANVAEREATLKNAENLVERRQALVKNGTISREAFEDSVRARDEARARLQSMRETMKLVTAGFREEDIAVATAQLAAAQARVDSAKTSLADTQLYAPESGVILSRVREPGAIVAAGATAYTVSLTDPVWIRTYVAETRLGHVAPGMKVEVFTDTSPNKPYSGQVGFISPVAEFTPKTVETADLRADLVYRVRVVVTNPDNGLRQGMPVTVRLIEPVSTQAAVR
ncbi:MAG: hlyD [Rhodospirillales bacterium]|jgi:HlyD family secretion protein|nr:hlyD [Rhodospirillales bacterium]